MAKLHTLFSYVYTHITQFLLCLTAQTKKKLILLNIAVHSVVSVTLFYTQAIQISVHRPPVLNFSAGLPIPPKEMLGNILIRS
jgi:hypothetical protein